MEYDAEGDPVAVYDAEYKPLGDRPGTDDLYQVFTYCHRLHVDRGVLVLPGRESASFATGPVAIEQYGLPVLAIVP